MESFLDLAAKMMRFSAASGAGGVECGEDIICLLPIISSGKEWSTDVKLDVLFAIDPFLSEPDLAVDVADSTRSGFFDFFFFFIDIIG